MADGIGPLIREVSDLIIDIADGGEKALGKLFSLTAPKILTMAKRYLNDKNKGEDVVSEVFVLVVKNAKTFKESGNGLNWLYKIAKNTALNFNKKDGKEEPMSEEIADLAVAFDATDDNLERIALRDALLKLTAEERKMLYHRYWEGLTIRELAKTLNQPVMTVHYALKKSLKKLEGLLK